MVVLRHAYSSPSVINQYPELFFDLRHVAPLYQIAHASILEKIGEPTDGTGNNGHAFPMAGQKILDMIYREHLSHFLTAYIANDVDPSFWYILAGNELADFAHCRTVSRNNGQ
ncbi:MAG: hypothetical protein ACYC9S_13125 [Leptospirales bacterium]